MEKVANTTEQILAEACRHLKVLRRLLTAAGVARAADELLAVSLALERLRATVAAHDSVVAEERSLTFP